MTILRFPLGDTRLKLNFGGCVGCVNKKVVKELVLQRLFNREYVQA
jgi:hypothetical protein